VHTAGSTVGDYHGDMQAYGAAKARLFDWPGLAAAVVNSDDAFGRELARTLRPSLRRLRFGLLPLADGGLPEFHAADVRTGGDGLGFTLVTPDGAAPVTSALLGRFNVGNLLGVAAVLHALDWSWSTTRTRPTHWSRHWPVCAITPPAG
jgi:UDP-N-acetylmuramoyl-L-alanyl-D-glutamate--2,6-diaminopimelate ligase